MCRKKKYFKLGLTIGSCARAFIGLGGNKSAGVAALKRVEMKRRRKHHREWITVCAALFMASPGERVSAQESPDNLIMDSDVFVGSYWSQIRPNYEYLNGCETGFRSFSFTRDGYFVFDNKVHGSWRVDRLGNLVLRTKEGKELKLSHNQSGLLVPIVSNNQLAMGPPNPASGGFYFRRTDQFQQCAK